MISCSILIILSEILHFHKLMNKKNIIMAFLLVALVIAAFADDANISIAPVEQWSNVFAGKESVFHFAVSSDKSIRGRLGWRFSSTGRTIARREIPLAVEPEEVETIEVRVQVPKVKEGVIMQALLSLSVFQEGTKEALADFEKEIWIFPEDPFANRKEWLKNLKIHLFDPEKKTAELFENAEIPFEQTSNIDSFLEITNGVVIIGEGISFRDYRGLSDMMVKTAVKGVPVLCLASADGDMTIPGMGNADLPRPTSMTFRQNDIINELDKRLDADTWPPDGKVKVSSVILKGERGPVIGEIKEARSTGSGQGCDGWPWMELKFGKKRKPVRRAPLDSARGRQGRLVICGFGIIEKWESGPTPRFLFARILKYMARNGVRALK